MNKQRAVATLVLSVLWGLTTGALMSHFAEFPLVPSLAASVIVSPFFGYSVVRAVMK
jgi:hypothetical protein